MGVSRTTTQSPTAWDRINLTVAGMLTRLKDQGYRYRIHPNETAAGMTDNDLTFGFEPFDVRRYGATLEDDDNGTTFNAAGLAASQTGGVVRVPRGHWKLQTLVEMLDSVRWKGSGPESTKLLFSQLDNTRRCGIGSRVADLGVRTFNQGMYDLTISADTSEGWDPTGFAGVSLDSVSTSEIANVIITGFQYGLATNAPTNGYVVYNNYYKVTANDCTTGFVIQGEGTNACVYDTCRFNGLTNSGTTAFLIDNANGNQFLNSHIDVVHAGYVFTASNGAGWTDSNLIQGDRVENCTGDVYNMGANCRYNTVVYPGLFNITGTIWVDNGTRNNIIAPPNLVRVDLAGVNGAGGLYQWKRSVDGGASLPAVLLWDSVNGTDTQLTLGIINESTHAGAKYWSGKTGGVEKCSDDTTGKATRTSLVVTGATPTAGSSQIAFGTSNQITVGTAGGASAPPATPSGYLKINISGTDFVLAYYKAS